MQVQLFQCITVALSLLAERLHSLAMISDLHMLDLIGALCRWTAALAHHEVFNYICEFGVCIPM